MISCKSNQNITGKYRSNFPDLGFFMTEIVLKYDKSFHYKFSGDLEDTQLDGNYKIESNTLYLRFNKLRKIVEPNDSLIDWYNEHTYDLKVENGIEYHLKYQIRGNRLYSYNILTGKIVSRVVFAGNRRKYILFGPKSFKKERYLKKIINNAAPA
jgi:hypothetical protein